MIEKEKVEVPEKRVSRKAKALRARRDARRKPVYKTAKQRRHEEESE